MEVLPSPKGFFSRMFKTNHFCVYKTIGKNTSVFECILLIIENGKYNDIQNNDISGYIMIYNDIL